MTLHPPPSPVYLGPPAHFTAGSNKPIRRITLHSTVSPTVEGGARLIAGYFRSPKAGGSAHYVIDPDEVVQAAYDNVVCWHAPPNRGSLGLEMCDMPDAKTGKRWWSRPHNRMLRRTAKLTAELLLAYDLPLRFLTAQALRANPDAEGITTHAETSQAFGQSTHWDPGKFPRARFMVLVRQYRWRLVRARRRAAAGKPSAQGPVTP